MAADAVAKMREFLMDRMTRHREKLADAAQTLREFVRDVGALDAAVEAIKGDIAENNILDSPTGVVDRELEESVQLGPWYSGPEAGDRYWPDLRERLLHGSLAEVLEEIDQASTKVVAQLANPRIYGLKKLGLVLGYVQSGKTANFTAVMAKAADRGVGLIIVLSGIHNNLRQQTQARVTKDLGLESGNWVSLTTADADFVNDTRHSGASQLRSDRPVVIVIKKNQSRLQSLLEWLEATPEDILRRTPVLLIDDEADQATPNGASGREERSAINDLVRRVWGAIRTGTYVGYTATPFANVFMDPDDETDLYPSNFIIDLPRPEEYFGAEKLFGREPLREDDEGDSGLDMVRAIPDEEAAALRPPSDRIERETWDVDLPPSLKTSILWFVVASAIRRARGQRDHSSMLVHTTHYADPHFAMQNRVASYVREVAGEWRSGSDTSLRDAFFREAWRVRHASVPEPDWDATRPELTGVLDDLRVIVDNGASEDRLNYDRVDQEGEPLKETVIAIGGGTLSRGLTLEGLVVSYFTRTSNTYDTLLQMGRWFGYRNGYEDLPRVWLQTSLTAEYRFLALVEAEIRQDIRDMELQRITPREMGIRVRQHPGRLAIVARNKMGAAQTVQVSYAGERLQTFIFDRDVEVQAGNIGATRRFLDACEPCCSHERSQSPPRWRYRDVSADIVSGFIGEYAFHPNQVSMDRDLIQNWIDEIAPDSLWNVTVIGSGKPARRPDGTLVELGSLPLGVLGHVPAVNRAPLTISRPGTANIKALLNHADWFADLDPSSVGALDERALKYPRSTRRRLARGRGQIIIYVVSKNSVPLTAASQRSREDMNAREHMVGLGIIFPEVADRPRDATYLSVIPAERSRPTSDDEDDELPPDTEGNAQAVVGAEVEDITR